MALSRIQVLVPVDFVDFFNTPCLQPLQTEVGTRMIEY